MKHTAHTSWKYKFIYFLRYLGDASFYPFYSLYLFSLGFTGTKYGFLISILPFMGIIANPFWILFSKNPNNKYLLVKIMILIETIFILLFVVTSQFELIIIILVGIGIVNTPYYSVQDSITASFCAKENTNYPSIRIFGSLAYALATFCGGFIIIYGNYKMVFLVAIITYLVVLIIWQFSKRDKKSVAIKDTVKGSMRELLRSKKLIIYIFCYMLGFGAIGIGDNYFAAYLKDSGISEVIYGIIYGTTVLAEVIAMRFLIKTKRFRHNYRLVLIIAFSLIALRNIVFFFEPPIYILAFAACLRGVGGGFCLVVHIKYITKITKQHNWTYAVLISAAVYALFLCIMNIVFGAIYEVVGFNIVFLIIAIFAIFACLIAIMIKNEGEAKK